MNSMVQYIRQLNQESIHVRDEWLEHIQLGHTELPTDTAVPEIVLVDGEKEAATLESFDLAESDTMPLVETEVVNQTITLEAADASAAISMHQQWSAAELQPITIEAPVENVSFPEPLAPLQPIILAEPPAQPDHVEPESPESALIESSKFQYSKIKRHKRIDALANQIVDRFPPFEPASLLFVSISRETDVDSLSAKLATCMSVREIGDILLVDANMNRRALSREVAFGKEKGVAEFINRSAGSLEHVRETDNARLNFLGAGQGPLTNRKLDDSKIRRFSTELKRRYQYTVISGGCIGDLLADSLASAVDAVYVMVEMNETDRNHAKDSVDYLRQLGARVVGCITTQR